MSIDENEFFHQATLRISSSLTVETAMRRCMDYLNGYLPVSGMFFMLYEPEINIAKVLASIWPPGLKKPGETISIPKEYRNWLKEAWAKDSSIRIINDIDLEASPLRQIMLLTFPPEISHLHMGLELENKRLGGVQFFTEGKQRYTQTHLRLVSLLHEPFAIALSNILQHQEILRLKDMLADDNRFLHQQMHQMTGDTIIGADFGLKSVMEMVRQVAPLNSPVLLMGETGAGKEVIANAIHFASQRRNNPYITVNCGAIPENLIDSELFGHEKGAFTGAIFRKRGRFERAHTGTIFLDEVGELPPAAQVRLLRVLQQREIERVGGTESIPVDVRLISATHQNLPEMVSKGTFREDLWFRLNVFPIMIPPLRQRVEDIPALVNHFIEKKSRELKISKRPALVREALEQLQGYHWPGNVRELENLVERALILNQITGRCNPLRFEPPAAETVLQKNEIAAKPDSVIQPLEDMIASHIQKALEYTDGKVEGEKGAAKLLGLHPSTLRGRMNKLGVPYGRSARRLKSFILILVLLVLASTSEAGAERDWALTLYGGKLVNGTLSETSTLNTDFNGAYFLDVGLSRRLYTYRDYLSFEVEGQVAKYFGDQQNWEFNMVGYLRWLPFIWDKYLETSFAAGAGLSYATSVPEVEIENHGDSAQLLGALMFEFAFSLPNVPQWSLIAGIHHRSGAGGFFSGVHGASNGWKVGLRYSF